MGEYQQAVIYKPMYPVSFLSGKFNKICWDLYHAREDFKRTEEIYREIGFVNERGQIFDLMMRFIEKNGQLYQTNHGVLGYPDLPNLFLSYKFEFHDFWLAIVKPSELHMSESGFIHTILTGEEIRRRFYDIEEANKNNPSFKESSVYKEFYQETKFQPSIDKILDDNDLVSINVELIYYSETEPYKDVARRAITKQRKDIANTIYIPHWAKAN